MAENDRPSPGDVVALARAGDRSAFEQLYRLHSARVYALCMRMTSSRDAAEELTQDVFVHLWRVLKSFRGESSFTTWLHSVTMNHILGRQRGFARRRAHEVPNAGEDFDNPGDPVDPGSSLDLEAAIRELPPQSRAVFLMHDVDGYRHHEIGSMLGIAEGTAKAHLHHARKMLRRRLEP